MNFRLAAVSTAVAAALALAACGGGGNDGNGGFFLPAGGTTPPPAPPAPPPPPPPPPAPAPAPVPAATTFMYESLPPSADRAAFLANLNAQGARGFRFLSGFAFTASTPSEVIEAYVRDLDTSYGYELKGITTSDADFLAQADEAGGRGFQFAGFYAIGGDQFNVYRKNNSAGATFSYRLSAMPDKQADYLAQANAQGADGYYNVSPGVFGSSGIVSIYEKSSAANATYSYELGGLGADEAAFFAQLNEHGARGLRFRTEYSFTDGVAAIYAKDNTQSATFSFYGLTPETTGTTYIQQANTEGANGNGLIGGLGLPGGKVETLYFKPVNCTGGALCVPTSLFGF